MSPKSSELFLQCTFSVKKKKKERKKNLISRT